MPIYQSFWMTKWQLCTHFEQKFNVLSLFKNIGKSYDFDNGINKFRLGKDGLSDLELNWDNNVQYMNIEPIETLIPLKILFLCICSIWIQENERKHSWN